MIDSRFTFIGTSSLVDSFISDIVLSLSCLAIVTLCGSNVRCDVVIAPLYRDTLARVGIFLNLISTPTL